MAVTLESLSLAARLAIALHLFAAYCERRGLAHPEVTCYVEHLWRFIGRSYLPEAFREWEADQPALIEAGLGGVYPAGFEDLLRSRHVPEAEFRHVICCTTEVLYSSLYGTADEHGSRQFVENLATIVQNLGVPFPDSSRFSASRWSDCGGWGKELSASEVADWRKTMPPVLASGYPGPCP